jgi:hypothetical protein
VYVASRWSETLIVQIAIAHGAVGGTRMTG